MKTAKRLGAAAAAGVVVLTLIAPTTADARNGRIAAGIFGGFAPGALIGAAMGGYWEPLPIITTAIAINVPRGTVGTGITYGCATKRAALTSNPYP